MAARAHLMMVLVDLVCRGRAELQAATRECFGAVGGNQKKWCIDKRKKAKTTKENGNDLGLGYEKSTRHIELAIHLVYRA